MKAYGVTPDPVLILCRDAQAEPDVSGTERNCCWGQEHWAVSDKLLCETSKPGKLRNMGNRKTMTSFDEEGAFSLV